MKPILFFILLFKTAFLLAQGPNILWSKTYGGTSLDGFQDAIQTSDGGFMIAGHTESNNGDVTLNHGISDVWVVKVSAQGTLLWQHSFGGLGREGGAKMSPTSDGGCILLAGAVNDDGDVTGTHGQNDAWVIKLSAAGSIEWQKALGGSLQEIGESIRQTADGGYIVAVNTFSTDGDITNNHGGLDAWVVKLSASGIIEWKKTYGGSQQDTAYCIQPTSDGGYIMVGDTFSNDGDVTDNRGSGDVWVVKLSEVGAIEWQRTYGGTAGDWGRSIIQTTEGGYLVGAGSRSTDINITNNHGSDDIWLLKLSSSGILEWQKSFGGSGYESIQNVQQTANGSYIIAGDTFSNDGDITENKGTSDAWLLKVSSTGSLVWQKTLGGSSLDHSGAVIALTGGGYLMTGKTYSNNGDIIQNYGSQDAWLVQLDSDLGNVGFESTSFRIFPNPAKMFLNIDLPDHESIQKLTIYDVLGQVVVQKSEHISQTNIEPLSGGIYWVQLQSPGNTYTQKFIKE